MALFSLGCGHGRTNLLGDDLVLSTLHQALPSNTRVEIMDRTGRQSKGVVRAVRDSSVVLEYETEPLIGHAPDSLVIPIDEIASIELLGTNPLQYVTTTFVISVAVVAVVVVVIVSQMDPLPSLSN